MDSGKKQFVWKSGIYCRAVAACTRRMFMRNLLRGSVFLLVSGLFFAGLPSDGAEARPSRSKTASATQPVLKKFTPYWAARGRLLLSGWDPVTDNKSADRCEKGVSRCEGKPEMQSCAGTAEANCVFLWKKNGRVREISTITKTIAGKELQVISGSKSCPLRLNKENDVQLCPSPYLD